MAKEAKFRKTSVTQAPSLSSILNLRVFIWLVISIVITFIYGYFIQSIPLGNMSIWQLIVTLVQEFVITAILVGIIIVFIHDKMQKDYPVQRVFPVLIWGRKLLVKAEASSSQFYYRKLKT